MKKIISVLFLLCVIVSGVLFYYDLQNYFIVSVTVTALVFIYLINCFFEEVSPESLYDKTLRELIKTYDSILVDLEKLPEIDVKNIINVSSFEKMVDVQYELKKPIFYKMSINSCSFILLDTDIAYIYVLRVDEDSFSPLDDIIASLEIDAKKRKADKKILDSIDRTTIIKLDNYREYKVSPVRKKDLSEEKDGKSSNSKKDVEIKENDKSTESSHKSKDNKKEDKEKR